MDRIESAIKFTKQNLVQILAILSSLCVILVMVVYWVALEDMCPATGSWTNYGIGLSSNPFHPISLMDNTNRTNSWTSHPTADESTIFYVRGYLASVFILGIACCINHFKKSLTGLRICLVAQLLLIFCITLSLLVFYCDGINLANILCYNPDAPYWIVSYIIFNICNLISILGHVSHLVKEDLIRKRNQQSVARGITTTTTTMNYTYGGDNSESLSTYLGDEFETVDLEDRVEV